MKEHFYLMMIAAAAITVAGYGSLAAQTTVIITPAGTDYEAGTVQFSVSWTGTPTPAGKVWVWIDYCPIAGVTPGTYGPASITAVAGTATASLNGRGFWVTASPAMVAATLASPPAQFNWCAHGSGYAPQAVPRAGGG
jgi:hypothetical protein